MKVRYRKYEEESPLETLRLREKLGLGKYRKRIPRDPEKRRILLKLALKRIEEQEKSNYILLSPRRRKLII